MGKKSKAPPPPDYKALAEQTAASQKAAADSALEANRPNQNNPYGSVSWEKGADGQWTQNTTLNPAEQAQLDANRNIQKGLTDTAGGLLGQAQGSLSKPLTTEGLPAWATMDPSKLPQGGDASMLNRNFGPLGSIGGGGGGGGNINYGKLGEFGSMADYQNKNNMDAGFGAVKEVQDAMTALNAPGRQQAREGEIQRLKSQGITEDSPAWTRAMQRLETGDMEAQNRALLAATGEYGNIFQRGLAQNEQGFGQGMDIANLTDRQRAQRLQEQATQGQFDEGRASRALQGDIAGANLQSQNQNQMFNQMLAQQQLASSLRGQAWGEQGDMANMTGNQRQAMLNEQERLRQSPLNDLQRLMGSNPSNPVFGGFSQDQGAGAVDYSGAGAADYKAKMDAVNAANARKGGMWNGLFGLAGSALGGPLGGMAGKAIGNMVTGG
jgi:hypothetical protein